MDKTWNIKIYNILILYWDNVFQVLYSCDFRTPLTSAFWCKNYSQYNLENGFFDLDKTWRETWNVLAKKQGTLCMLCAHFVLCYLCTCLVKTLYGINYVKSALYRINNNNNNNFRKCCDRGTAANSNNWSQIWRCHRAHSESPAHDGGEIWDFVQGSGRHGASTGVKNLGYTNDVNLFVIYDIDVLGRPSC